MNGTLPAKARDQLRRRVKTNMFRKPPFCVEEYVYLRAHSVRGRGGAEAECVDADSFQAISSVLLEATHNKKNQANNWAYRWKHRGPGELTAVGCEHSVHATATTKAISRTSIESVDNQRRRGHRCSVGGRERHVGF